MPKTVAVVLSDDQKAKLEKKSKELGLTLSEIIRGGLDLFLELDPVVVEKVKTYAAAFGMPEGGIISNTLIDRFARDAARLEVQGPSTRILLEFVTESGPSGKRIVTGGELFANLTASYIQEYENEKEADLLHEQHIGAPISPSEQEWLQKRFARPKTKTPDEMVAHIKDPKKRRRLKKDLEECRKKNKERRKK